LGKEIETLSRKGIEKVQVEKLNHIIGVAMQSPYYGNLYAGMGIKPGAIDKIEDVRKLPFTTKQDLRNNFLGVFLSIDKKDVVRLHSSSGTTGILR
jgi:phenylacetate-CoA ligase